MVKTLQDEKLVRKVVREEITRAFERELIKLRLLLVPEISDREQKEIESFCGKPTRRVGRTLRR